MRVYYDPRYVATGIAFDTTRKSAAVATSLSERPIPGVVLCSPVAVTDEVLRSVHDSRYIDAVRTGCPHGMARSNGLGWDSGLWTSVTASSGGVVEAARTAIEEGVSGSLSTGLHHARRLSGKGCCTFNGLAIAAFEALKNGARSVLILDLDAHCGGGTHSIIERDARISQVDVAVDGFDQYLPRAPNSLDLVHDVREYLPILRARLASVESSTTRADLCLYNAGVDLFERSRQGGMRGITREILVEREDLIFSSCARLGIPVAFVLAGGYQGETLTAEEVVDLHRLTIAAAARVWVRRHDPGQRR